MKKLFGFLLILLLPLSGIILANSLFDTTDRGNNPIAQEMASASRIEPYMIQVYPQPVSVGDATVKISLEEKIISTSIYTITGERMAHQMHDEVQKVQKNIPYQLPQGEYLLKLVTENGIGLKKIFVR